MAYPSGAKAPAAWAVNVRLKPVPLSVEGMQVPPLRFASVGMTKIRVVPLWSG